MQTVEIREVVTKADMKKFIYFNYKLYEGSPYAVPDLYMDVENNFNPKKNAGLEFCDVKLFLAYRGNEVVGRIAGIINHRANKTWNDKYVRFGWIDFIDDIEVCRSLLKAVEDWGRDKGMTDIHGPLGITDMDPEGMLIEGFDRIGTMSTIYNYPYYPKLMEAIGYEKGIDWIEMRMLMPKTIPEKFKKIGDIVKARSKVHIKKLNGEDDLFNKGYGQRVFNLINEAYAPLYGYSEMTERQIEQYVKEYLPMVDMRMVTIVETDDTNEVVGVGISMPSIVRTLQKVKGRLFPFGWLRLLNALKWHHEDGVELLLVAVKPEYQNKGINSLLFCDLIPIFNEMGFKWAETNPQLETNSKGQAQWQYIEHEIAKRRRCYKKSL